MTEYTEGTGDPDIIHVACVADANYGPYAGIALASVLISNPNARIHMHVFSDRIRERDIARLREMAKQRKALLSVYDVAQTLDERGKLKIDAHLSRATYGRLFMADLLPSTVSSVIYLDCDVMCVDSLNDLWGYREHLSTVGAVRDVWIDQDKMHKRRIGMGSEGIYYNCGVLLMNVAAWRGRNLTEALLEFFRQQSKPRYHDQDAINVVLEKEILELPRRWNVLISSPNPAEIAAQLKKAANIHFCAGLKPWHFGYTLLSGVGGAAFRQAKAASPWRWMLPDFQFGRVLRKLRQSRVARSAA